jgi:hypothetical protein
MWPKIAKMFDMDYADPIPTPLATYMTDKSALWEDIVARYGLQSIPYDKLVAWKFGDFIFNSGYDNVSSTIKARKAGFQACIDSEDMFKTIFQQMRENRIIPPLA